jgi:hypothetical protein
LERYRALDTLAATVFQTGLAAFIGGVVIALAVHSAVFKIAIGSMSVPPFCAAGTAGFAMLDIGHEDPEYPTFHDLRAKRLSALYEEKLREQQSLNQQVELLRRLVGHATGVSRGRVHTNEQSQDGPSEEPRRRRAAPAQDRAVQALEQAANALGGTAVGPTSL